MSKCLEDIYRSKTQIILAYSFINAPPDRIKIPIIKRAISGFQFIEIDDDKGLLAKAISFTIAFLSGQRFG